MSGVAHCTRPPGGMKGGTEGGSGSRPRWTISEDAEPVIRKCRDVATATVVLCLQSCRSVTKYWRGRGGRGVGGGVGWGARHLGATALIIKASRASPTSCLLLNLLLPKKDASLSPARPERARSQPRRLGVWLSGARHRYQAGNSGAAERKRGSGRSEGR